jgi:PAS domain S-box-containing protein
MNDTAPTPAELAALQQRIAEAEDLNRAIRSGEVDAFVVGRDENDNRVLLLANAYQRYRYIVDRMDQGAVTVSTSGGVLFVNQKFVDLVGGEMSTVYGAAFQSNFPEAERPRVERLLASPASGKEIELDLVRSDGKHVPVHLHLASVTDGYATILVTELAQRQWENAARASMQRMTEALKVLDRLKSLDSDTRRAVAAIGAEVDALAGRLETLRPKF